MTPTEINREFAEKCMGWKFCIGFPSDYYIGIDGNIAFWVSDFDPYHRWDHAAMGLEKFDNWIVSRWNDVYFCRIILEYDEVTTGKWTKSEADTAPAAICLACIEAKKEKQ